MKKFLAVVALGLTLALTAGAQAPEPNQGSHIQFTANYDVNGGSEAQAALVGIRVPITNRWSGQFLTITAPNATSDGVLLSLGEAVYERNLADVIRSRSNQVNPSRFTFSAFGGAGSLREAGNSDPALSVGGNLNYRVNDTFSVTLIEYRYVWSNRQFSFQRSDFQQIAPGVRISF